MEIRKMDKKELMEFAFKDLKEMFSDSEYVSIEMHGDYVTIFSVKNFIPSSVYEKIINSYKIYLCGTSATNNKIRIDIILTKTYIDEIKRNHFPQLKE